MVSHVTCLGLVGILDFTVLCHTGMVLHLQIGSLGNRKLDMDTPGR